MWRSSDGTNWNQVNTDGFGDADNDDATRLTVFGSQFYVGVGNFATGCQVWHSSDGTSWNQVNTDGFGDSDNYLVDSMAVFNNYLYVGTENHTAGCEVWRFSPPPYDVTIDAYCNTVGEYVSVSIDMDGSPTGYATPHTFEELTGTHTFTVPDTDIESHDPSHPFKQWITSETSRTITITESGTYTAYYEATATIPTLTEWGMIIFMTLILGIGVAILYRRRIV